jgi:hypothetical protein
VDELTPIDEVIPDAAQDPMVQAPTMPQLPPPVPAMAVPEIPPAPPVWGPRLRRWGHAMMCYAVPFFLLTQLGWEIGSTVVSDRAPVLQAPPIGYTAVKPSTTLVWNQNGLTGEFQVQLIDSEGHFDQPVFQKTVSAAQISTPALDPDRTYTWRVTHVESGMMSGEMSFKTARHLFAF